ncbi:hypothetical protein [Alkalinema sp. FACHB-956]|uniref:hypothetical protein n=1 Tax=Alkalinema sp. FACHB-956 TaxID=2692768 RepID=UPI00168554C8|nr:hypothetical protein [Alkalinema sp. FACHB-956]MBD2326944.1 hypothetical protein [Alkalinema sp. FACHB-956]
MSQLFVLKSRSNAGKTNGSMSQKPRSMSPRRVSNDIDAAITGAIVITAILKRKLKCWKDREWKSLFLSGQSA